MTFPRKRRKSERESEKERREPERRERRESTINPLLRERAHDCSFSLGKELAPRIIADYQIYQAHCERKEFLLMSEIKFCTILLEDGEKAFPEFALFALSEKRTLLSRATNIIIGSSTQNVKETDANSGSRWFRKTEAMQLLFSV